MGSSGRDGPASRRDPHTRSRGSVLGLAERGQAQSHVGAGLRWGPPLELPFPITTAVGLALKIRGWRQSPGRPQASRSRVGGPGHSRPLEPPSPTPCVQGLAFSSLSLGACPRGLGRWRQGEAPLEGRGPHGGLSQAVRGAARAARAQSRGCFRAEIVPVTTTVHDDKGTERSVTVAEDEGIRPSTSMEGLAQLKPAFKTGGSTTAGETGWRRDWRGSRLARCSPGGGGGEVCGRSSPPRASYPL